MKSRDGLKCAVLGLLLISAVSQAQPISVLMRADGLLEKIDSEYNSILVEKSGSYISLNFGYRNIRYTESSIDWSRKDELVVTYTRYMTAALAYGRYPVKRIALVGLGGGRTISYLSASLANATADVAELDPAVIDVAKRYFGVNGSERLRIHAEDGRMFLRRTKDKFDLILLDAYRGPFVPFHLTTKEFYQLVKDRLASGGVVAQNVEPTTMFFDSAFLTMKAVFDQVDAIKAGGNIVLIGYSGKRLTDDELSIAASKWQSQYGLKYDLRELVKARQPVRLNATAQVLTDDFAPVEYLKTIKRDVSNH